MQILYDLLVPMNPLARLIWTRPSVEDGNGSAGCANMSCLNGAGTKTLKHHMTFGKPSSFSQVRTRLPAA